MVPAVKTLRTALAPVALLVAAPLLLGARPARDQPAPSLPAPFHEQLNVDAVGTHAEAFVTPAAWAALAVAAPDLAAPDAGLDAIAFAGPAHPAAPKKVQLALREHGPVTLLVGFRGEAARAHRSCGPPLPAARMAPVRSTSSRARTCFLSTPAAPGPGVAVSAGEGRSLSIVHLDFVAGLALEVRNPQVDVVVLGVASGELLPVVRPTTAHLEGFPIRSRSAPRFGRAGDLGGPAGCGGAGPRHDPRWPLRLRRWPPRPLLGREPRERRMRAHTSWPTGWPPTWPRTA